MTGTLRVCAIAILMAAAVLSAMATDGDATVGKAIFQGQGDPPGHAVIGGSEAALDIARFSCGRCHGRGGQGGSEGGAPAITWPELTRRTAGRPAYDLDSFSALLRDGVSAGAREIDRVMPRYHLTDDAIAGLAAYLAELPSLDRRGVSTTEVSIGVAIPDDNRAPALDFARLLESELARSQSNRLFGRNIVVRRLSGASSEIIQAAQNEVLAIVGLVPSNDVTIADMAKTDTPVLFPLALLEGDEDRTLVRGSIATRRSLLGALLARTAEDGCKTVAIVDVGGKPPLEAPADARVSVRLSDGAGPSIKGADALIVVGADAAKAAAVMAKHGDLPVYMMAGDLTGPLPTSLKRSGSLTVVTGFSSGSEPGRLLERHASLTAELLRFSLLKNGRSLTRSGLVAAFDRSEFPELNLDYRRFPLEGTDALRVVRSTAN